tara:strand:- start:2796 stop:3617 length:822 start_codon:yes stop_codon:yes gene_type:complete
MLKIAHEAPVSIFDRVNEITDYSYCLVHLLEQNDSYLNKFLELKDINYSLQRDREIILDNSIFELGKSFDSDKFSHWINKLKPDWYVVPDTLEDCEQTIENMKAWNTNYTDIPGKKIGVVQGQDYEEIKKCYKYMDEEANVDMIAISFDYSWYQKLIPHPNKYVSWMLGRVALLSNLVNDNIININKKHHLLGVSLPQEGLFYKSGTLFKFNWIYSVDTSNPVVHGIKSIKYGDNGLWNKQSQKLHTMIDVNVSVDNLVTILNNIYKFKFFWK